MDFLLLKFSLPVNVASTVHADMLDGLVTMKEKEFTAIYTMCEVCNRRNGSVYLVLGMGVGHFGFHICKLKQE